MDAMQRGEGAEDRRREEYPPEPQEGPEMEVKAQLKSCETCGLNFMTVPQGWNAYIHKHCCSRCTATGGWSHTKRCREKTKYMQRSIDPYKNYWQGVSRSSQDGAGWWHQGWQQRSWSAQDWIRP
eukprot:1992780-Heterocapsa_arctica.AAC.1